MKDSDQSIFWSYSFDELDCEACVNLNDTCPYHYGVRDGVGWMSKHIERIGRDPEILNSLAQNNT